MRPIQKHTPVTGVFEFPLHDIIMDAIGDSCSFCERKLQDIALVWNKSTMQVEARERGTAGEWQSYLIICTNCADCAAHAKNKTPELLYPDEALTFNLGSKPPFVYTLEKTLHRFTDEAGTVVKEETMDAVIVSGNTAEAKATIDYFGLNSDWYDEAAKTFTIPLQSYLSTEDRRVQLRTDIWKVAENTSKVLHAASDSGQQDLVLGIIRQHIYTAGFWSVWMTVLWSEFKSKPMLAALVPVTQAPDNRSRKRALAPFVDKSPYNPMPATHPGWMND